MVATRACCQASCGAPRRRGLADLGTQAAADSCGQDGSSRDIVLVVGAAVWLARWILGSNQRDHRAAIEFRRHNHGFARPDTWDLDWGSLRLFVFAFLVAALELRS